MQNLVNFLEDLYYINIRGLHKHIFKGISDATILMGSDKEHLVNYSWQRHKCVKCGKVYHLNEDQINSLPPDMKYEKIKENKK